MDRFEAMTILLAAVETGSLSGAGRKLGVPLPTISRKLTELEAHLNTRLLIRSTRQLDLTEAGRAYVAASKRILEDVANAERAASGEYMTPKGELVLTAPVAFGRLHVLPVVTEFLKRFSEIDITLVLSDRLVHLVQDHVDLALRIGALPDSSMLARKLGVTRWAICASPAYLAAHGTPQTADAIADHAAISFSSGLTAPNVWVLGQGTIQVRPRLVVNTAEAAVDAAAAGLGITRVLCYQSFAARQAGKLVEVLHGHDPQEFPVHFVYSGQGILPQKLSAFLDFATPPLRAALIASGI